MFNIEQRKSIWSDFCCKNNLNFISREDFLEIKENITNPLILPSPFLSEKTFEIIKNRVKGEIYTEVLNLFFFIKVKIEYISPKFYVYELDIKSDSIKIEEFDLENYKKESFIEKAFTPKGIEEFLKFKNLRLKEVWGDYPSGKIKDETRFLLLRIDKK